MTLLKRGLLDKVMITLRSSKPIIQLWFLKAGAVPFLNRKRVRKLF